MKHMALSSDLKRLVAGSLFMAGLAHTPAEAADLEVAAPILPPHVTKDGEGREASIVKETLEACGHTVTFKTAFFGSHWKWYKKREEMDAVTTVPPSMSLDGYRTQTYVQYQNGVSVLEKSGLDIRSVSDLKGLDIATFQNGISILGLADERDSFGKVYEIADQKTHSRLLFGGRVDAVLSDGLIFAALNRSLRESDAVGFDPHQKIRFTAVVSPSPYDMVFRDAEIRDDFNRCFNQLKDEGRIEAINKEYVSRFRKTVGEQYLGY